VASCAGFDVARVPGLWWTGLAQDWGMYADPARLPSGWFLVVATTKDGRDVDELHGGLASDQRPPQPFSAYADFRTRRVFEALLHPEYQPFLDETGRWQCRAHPDAVRMRGWFADDRVRDAEGKPTLFALFDVACR
jgi:hypothetical protein